MLHRDEWGLRGGFLIGPGFNGLEGNFVADVWYARSVRRPLSPWANFSSYHPIWNSGVFLRYQWGFLIAESSDVERLYTLEDSHTVVVGWRGQFRFPEERPR